MATKRLARKTPFGHVLAGCANAMFKSTQIINSNDIF